VHGLRTPFAGFRAGVWADSGRWERATRADVARITLIWESHFSSLSAQVKLID